MTRPNLYDRLYQKRQAAEALALQQAEQARLDAQAQAARVAPPPVLTPDVRLNALCIAGLTLRLPDDMTFQKVEATLERGHRPVSFSACITSVLKVAELAEAVDQLKQRLHEHHPGLDLVRQADYVLAGHPAISLDYAFVSGQQRRYGRTVGALLMTTEGTSCQWLEVSTLIDPDESALADWLPEFDVMLANMTTYQHP